MFYVFNFNISFAKYFHNYFFTGTISHLESLNMKLISTFSHCNYFQCKKYSPMDSFSLWLKFHCLYLQCILNLSFAIHRLFFQELTGKPIWNESHCQKKFWEITYVLHSRACTKQFLQWDLHFYEFQFDFAIFLQTESIKTLEQFVIKCNGLSNIFEGKKNKWGHHLKIQQQTSFGLNDIKRPQWEFKKND